jgi:hypothetical protein
MLREITRWVQGVRKATLGASWATDRRQNIPKKATTTRTHGEVTVTSARSAIYCRKDVAPGVHRSRTGAMREPDRLNDGAVLVLHDLSPSWRAR